jgi:hypothetical protein
MSSCLFERDAKVSITLTCREHKAEGGGLGDSLELKDRKIPPCNRLK